MATLEFSNTFAPPPSLSMAGTLVATDASITADSLGPGDRVLRAGHAMSADDKAAVTFPTSDVPRGLSLTSIRIGNNYDGLAGWLLKHQSIYFMTIAADLSGKPPEVYPSAESIKVDEHVAKVGIGEPITFTLGSGAPVYGPRQITGGLALFILIMEADHGGKKVKKVLDGIHDVLAGADGTVVKMVTKLISSPASATVGLVLEGVTAALQPIGEIIAANDSDCVGMLRGVFEPRSPWTEDQLVQRWNNNEVRLAELHG